MKFPSLPTVVFAVLFLSVAATGCAPDGTEAGSEPAADESAAEESAATMSRPDPLVPDGENMAVPATWRFRPDRTDREYSVGTDSTADVVFVNMTPGWHITSGPAGIYYHPASTAEGRYSASTEIHLFEPGDRREAFGLMIGGQDLDGNDQRYTYFLIRQGGEYLIKERRGEETRVLSDWTRHDAVKSHTGGASDTALNTLAIEVGADSVSFLVNGEQVATLPKTDVMTDGIVGLRINHGLNLHVQGFAVAPSA